MHGIFARGNLLSPCLKDLNKQVESEEVSLVKTKLTSAKINTIQNHFL